MISDHTVSDRNNDGWILLQYGMTFLLQIVWLIILLG